MKIVASVQARMGSKRFPGKVLKKVCGIPLLVHQCQRLKNSKIIDHVIVATTDNSLDDEIETVCKKFKIDFFRGSENDVLCRVSNLIEMFSADLHVECFGDSPFVDPEIIDQFLGYIIKNYSSLDFVSNTLKSTYPPGFEVIIYKGKILLDVNNNLKKTDKHREHVGYNITRFPKKYRIKNIKAPEWYNFPNLHLEVDEPVDLELISFIIEYFDNKGIKFYNLAQILDVIKKNPEISKINSNIKRRWKDLQNNDV